MKFKEVAISDASTEAKVAALALLLDKELVRLAETVLNVKKLEGPKGEQGIQGPKGEQGDRGFDGANGKDGIDGKDGKDGEAGERGVGVADAKVDFDGSLVITLTDGTEINAGDVLPLDTAEKIRVIGNGGGTSQYVLDAITDLQTQINNFQALPSQTGNAGKYLTTNGTTASWATVSSTGSESDPIYTASSWYTTTNNASNWNTAYTDRNKWDGGATGLVAATGRTSLGLGTAATTAATDYATAAQGAKADTALQSITSANVTTALGYTPYNSTNPNGYTSNTGTVTSVAVSGGTTGLTTSGGPVTSSGTISLAGTLAVSNGGTGATTASAALTNLGAYAASNPSGYTSNTGTVTSVAALTLGTTGTDVSSTVATGTTTPVITLNIPTASATNRGALSAADWTTFNNKGNGTVTSVTGTSPVTSSGGATPAIGLASGYGDTQNPFASKTANYVLAAPNGVAGAPTFRALVASDIPTLNQNTTGTSSNVTGTVAVANGGTGATTASAALTALGAYPSSNPSGYTSNTGTVTSVGMTVPTGLSVTGSPVTSSGTLALSMTTGYAIPTTASQTNWDTAYTDRNKWDGGATGLVASTGRTSLGVTATGSDTTYAYRANNLSDLANATAARSNLGLGSAATLTAGSANGVATLDSGGKIPSSQLPSIAITDTFVVNSQATMLALTAETGDVAVRTDLNKSFILTASPASTLANWQELLTPTDAVTSVAGRTGAVTLSTSDISGLGTIATQAANNVNITGGSIAGITDLAVADGGTGASTAAGARTNLGLVIGTDVLAPNGSAASLISFPTLNQNTTGTAAGLSGTQTANYVYAAPNGLAGTASFRALVAADIPTLNQNTTGTASNVTGTVAIANGGTGSTTASGARTNLGLGTAATTASTDYATAAQGTKADTAYGWGNHATYGYLTSSSTLDASKLSGTIDGGTY